MSTELMLAPLLAWRNDKSADPWISGVAKHMPHATPEECCLASSVVLEALLYNLSPEHVDTILAGLNPSMAERVEEIAARCAEPRFDESLVNAVAGRLPPSFRHHACLVTRAVLAVIAERVPKESIVTILAALPARWRKLWPRDAFVGPLPKV